MAGIQLDDYQFEAVDKMHKGCILKGGVGSGKSRTALAYYYICSGGKLRTSSYAYMKNPPDLYIITTAKKRDDLDWENEMAPFLLSTHPEVNSYVNKVVVDSWNNIEKYRGVSGAFFIFDEQRAIGKGKWAKSFIWIAKHNHWIMLSATPGDKWEDYVPVFIANGFYKNRTEFESMHFVYKRGMKYPVVMRVLNEGRLMKLRKQILIDMDFVRSTVSHHEDVWVQYDHMQYRFVSKERKHPETLKPIKNASEFCYLLRKIVNSDESRAIEVLEIALKHPKLIIFYNFDYELEILKSLRYVQGTAIAEYNGHKHQGIPFTERWVYLVQYSAGAEGWNCTQTDTMLFYSQNYSYKIMEQSSGRIDRRNTPYSDLYYYHLKSRSPMDMRIATCLREKKRFNEVDFFEGRRKS